MSNILGPSGAPIGEEPRNRNAEINVNGRVFFRDHVVGGVRWMVRDSNSIVSHPKPSDFSTMCEVMVQTMQSLNRWQGDMEWCTECDAPQWVQPNGDHACMTLKSAMETLSAAIERVNKDRAKIREEMSLRMGANSTSYLDPIALFDRACKKVDA